MAKYEITEKGCAGHEIGDVLETKDGPMPGWLVGKAIEIKPKVTKVAVTNPAKGGGAKTQAAD